MTRWWIACFTIVTAYLMFRNAPGPQPNYPVNGVGWKSAVLANLNFAQSSAFSSLVARARACMKQKSQAGAATDAPERKTYPGNAADLRRWRICEGRCKFEPGGRSQRQRKSHRLG